MKRLLGVLLFFAVFVVSSGSALAQESDISVGVIERPPFATKVDDEWSGYSIEIIEEVARRSELSITFEEQTVFADMLTATANNTVDLSAANISITSNREDLLDFSTPIYESGLQIFVPHGTQSTSLPALL